MERIKELVKLTQQLNAVMDDTDSVFYMNTNSNGDTSFLADAEFMIEKFDDIAVIRKNDKDYPFSLETEIEGVGFHAYVRLDKSELLRGYVPDAWIDEITQPEKIVRKIKSVRINDSVELKKAD